MLGKQASIFKYTNMQTAMEKIIWFPYINDNSH